MPFLPDAPPSGLLGLRGIVLRLRLQGVVVYSPGGEAMKPEHEELWSRIRAFEIDDSPCALPFARKLARERTCAASG